MITVRKTSPLDTEKDELKLQNATYTSGLHEFYTRQQFFFPHSIEPQVQAFLSFLMIITSKSQIISLRCFGSQKHKAQLSCSIFLSLVTALQPLPMSEAFLLLH